MNAQTANRLTATLATGIFLILSILLASLSSHQRNDTFLQRPSSFFTDSSGARALFLIAKQFFPATEQWRRPIHLLPLPGSSDSAGTMITIGPTRPLAASEAEHLHRWLVAGGQLILLAANGWPLRQRAAAGERELTEESVSDDGTGETFLSGYAPGLHSTKAGQMSTGRAAGSSLPDGEMILGWRRSFAGTGGATVVASGGNAALAVEIPVGQGRIIAIADPTMASNGALRHSDNAVWLITLATGWSPGKVLFDEYHHGFGQKRSAVELTRAFFSTPWGWCVLQIIAAGLLYTFVYRRRFGRIREMPMPNRASPLELVEARAGVLRVAAAQKLAANMIVQHLCHTLGKVRGKTDDMSDLSDELENLARNRGVGAPITTLRGLLAKVQNGARLSDGEFVELGRTAGQIIKGQKL
jgi:uncharacterized protein DUF4350